MFRKIAASQTLLINQQMSNYQQQGKQIYRFGFGQSPFLPPNFVIDALKANAARKEYTNVQGDLALRERIADFHKRANGIQTKVSQVFVAPGSKVLIYAILAAHTEADVFLVGPSWVSYEPQVHLTGLNSIRIPTTFEERWRLSPEKLRAALHKKRYSESILILNYPGNPDGLSYTKSELEALAQIAKEENILVISDEIYALLSHGTTHHSFATFYPEKTITTTGLSKWCGAGGWRLGVALLPDQIDPAFVKALIGIASETYSCAPTPVQAAAIIAYDFERVQDYLEAQNRILHRVGTFCQNALQEAGVDIHPPEGGFYLFPDFSPFREQLASRGITTSTQLCEAILASTGVAMLPATAFGMPKTYLATRLCYIDFEDPLQQDIFDLERDCPRVLEGVKQLVGFLES